MCARILLLALLVSVLGTPFFAFAQENTATTTDLSAAAVGSGVLATTSSTSTATATVERIEEIATTTAPQRAPILPEESQVTSDVFEERPIETVTPLNIVAFFVQQAAKLGVPTETIALVLLLPFLITIVAFVRNVIGLTTLDILVPIMFAIAILASGVAMGIIMLATILVSSMLARLILKRLRIMQVPRVALSMLIVSFSVLFMLSVLAVEGSLKVEDVSIVPILLLILLSERIVRLQFEVAFKKTFTIVFTTLAIGVIGYLVLSLQIVRETILLYPELVLLLIPVNIMIGRYFGLRLTEYFRFGEIEEEE